MYTAALVTTARPRLVVLVFVSKLGYMYAYSRRFGFKISAMAFLILLPLSSSVSTAGEGLNLKLDYSLTNEQST